MTPNQEYKRLFSRNYTGLRDRKLFLYTDASARFRAAHEAELNRRRPKGKAGKTYELPAEVNEELRKQFAPELAEYDQLATRLKEADERNTHRMCTLAPWVTVVPCEVYHKVDSCSSDAYRTQGYGAEKYARGSLFPFEAMLKAAGLDPHISRVVTWRNPGGKYECDREGADFRLWVNCEPYIADAIKKRITLEEACKLWKSQTINPFVFNPFIPHAMGSF